MMQLRPYQQGAVDAIFDYWDQGGGNPLVDLATGTGKSVVISTLARRAIEQWPEARILALVHVKELVEQNAKALLRAWPAAPLGINSAGLGRRDKRSQILYASIQSVAREDAFSLGERHIIIVDEAHLIPTKGNGQYRTLINRLREAVPKARICGFTATPYRLDSGRLDGGDDRLFDQTVYSYDIGQGVDDGYLSPLISRATGAVIDVSQVKRAGGEFVAGALEAAADREALTAAACDEIIVKGADRRAWLVFCAGVAHAEHVRDAMRARGIHAETVTGDTPKAERDRLINAFREGRLRCLTNANVLTTGFDAPRCDLIAMLRPTLSTSLYVQMCLDMETEILARDGWKRAGQIAVGDDVAGFDMGSGAIRWQPVEEVVDRPIAPNEAMVGVSSPHLDIRVTDGHNLVTACRSSRTKAAMCPNWKLETAATAAKRQDQIWLPIAGKIDASGADISDAELSFLGWFLSDGTLSRANNAITISQSVESAQNVHIRQTLDECGFRYGHCVTERENGYAALGRYSISHGDTRIANGTGSRGWGRLSEWINADKTITSAYDDLSRRQLLVLLDAVCRGDGQKYTAPSVTWTPRTMSITCGKNYAMADRIQALCVTRGIRCNVSMSDPSNAKLYINPDKTKATIRGTRVDDVNKNARIIDRQAVDGERVWCVTTPMGTIITRRNGKVAIMGNCGRGTRLFDGKDNCLVLDFAANVRRHGPVDAVQVSGRAGGGEGKVAVDSVQAKECPNCETLVHVRVYECPHCGHEWDRPATPKHEAKADDEAAVMSRELKDRWLSVSSVQVFEHQKDGAPPSLRVEYQCGLTTYKEWVCVAHPGFAGAKGQKWWRSVIGTPAPTTAAEAVGRFPLEARVAAITIAREGKYWRVERRRAIRADGRVIEINEKLDARPASLQIVRSAAE